MFFLHENKTPEPPKARINYTKETNNWTLMLVGKFEKTDIKHKKAVLDLQFLQICEDHNAIPKFLRFKVSDSNLRSSSTYRQCQSKRLREES